jgi:ferredoxin hydrogenase small subunit
MENIGKMTRRQFLKLSGFTAAFCLIGVNFVGEAYAKTQEFIGKRLASVYKHDSEMSLRKSRDNLLVKKLYGDLLEHPLSHKSEELLHTEYTSRSSAVEQVRSMGIKLTV